MKKTLRDLYGTWILFFHYVKWPIFFGLPILYLEMGYERDTFMDVLWVYSVYLIGEALYRRFVAKTHCSTKGCDSKKSS